MDLFYCDHIDILTIEQTPKLKRERERECILKAQVTGVSMRPPLCTDADDLLHCRATVWNLGERGEPDVLT